MTLALSENVIAARLAGKRFTAFKADLETLCKAYGVALNVNGHYFICVEDNIRCSQPFDHIVNRLGIHEQ